MPQKLLEFENFQNFGNRKKYVKNENRNSDPPLLSIERTSRYKEHFPCLFEFIISRVDVFVKLLALV